MQPTKNHHENVKLSHIIIRTYCKLHYSQKKINLMGHNSMNVQLQCIY